MHNTHAVEIGKRLTSFVVCGLLAATSACGQSARSPQAPSDVQWTSTEDTGAAWQPFDTRHTHYVAGEQIVWRLSLLGLGIAEWAFAVGEPGAMQGRQTVVVRSRIRTIEAAAMVKDVHEEVTTFVDVATGRATYHRRELLRGSDLLWVESQLEPGTFDVSFRVRDQKPITERQTLPAGLTPYEVNSALLAMRGWNAEPGARGAAYVLRETHVWRLQIQYGGRETITTPLGEFRAIRLDGVTRALLRTPEFDPDVEARQFSLWLSDDDARIPLAMVAKTDVGKIKLEVVQYTPGTGR